MSDKNSGEKSQGNSIDLSVILSIIGILVAIVAIIIAIVSDTFSGILTPEGRDFFELDPQPETSEE